MWTDSSILRFTFLSALIGLLAFCICYSYLVWRKRNRHTRAQISDRTSWSRARGWSLGLMVLGLLAMAFSVAMREVVSVEGQLRGEGLFAVRAKADARPAQVAEEGAIQAEQPLVEFVSTQSESDREALLAKRSRLNAERQTQGLQPLCLDLERVRLHQNATVTAREKRATLDQLLGTVTTAERDLFDQIFKKQQSMVQVRGDLAVARSEATFAENKLKLSQRQLERERGIFVQGYISATEIEERGKEVQSLNGEVQKQRAKATAAEAELRQLEIAMGDLQSLAQRQNRQLTAEADQLRTEVQQADAELRQRLFELELDRELATQRRKYELAQLDWKIAEITAQVDGIAKVQRVSAPHAGWVVYRAPSPGAVKEHGILAVVGPENSFAFRATLSNNQVEALRNAGEVTIDVGEGNLLRRFPAKFTSATAIVGEVKQSLVTLDCKPSAELIETLLEGGKVKAKFIWQPPLLSLWPFLAGILSFLLGLVGRILVGLVASQNIESNIQHRVPQTNNVAMLQLPYAQEIVPTPELAEVSLAHNSPVTAKDTVIAEGTKPEIDLGWLGSLLETEAASEVVEMVAVRLREEIIHESLSLETVAAAEWTLDRHHLRAVRIFRNVFRRDRSYLAHLEQLPNGSIDGQFSIQDRVLRMLDAFGIGPFKLTAAVAQNDTLHSVQA